MLLAFLFLVSGWQIHADEQQNGNEENGETLIIYTGQQHSAGGEINKGEGRPAGGTTATGDAGITKCLQITVITSAILLMIVIFIRKGEKKYEKNEVYECNGINGND